MKRIVRVGSLLVLGLGLVAVAACGSDDEEGDNQGAAGQGVGGNAGQGEAGNAGQATGAAGNAGEGAAGQGSAGAGGSPWGSGTCLDCIKANCAAEYSCLGPDWESGVIAGACESMVACQEACGEDDDCADACVENAPAECQQCLGEAANCVFEKCMNDCGS